MIEIVGVHPHTECYPLLGDDELTALAADIAENGLRDPLTVTPDGLLIDGRNRLRACEIVGVEPAFVVYEGDVGALVRSRNLRRHQPVGSLAMSTALSMLIDNLRANGRWKYGTKPESNGSVSSAGWAQRIMECGVILDLKRELAEQVISGALALDKAYKMVCSERDAEKARQAEAARLAGEEDEARKFIEEHAPDLAAAVGGDIQTYVEALAVWEKRNREEAKRIQDEKDEIARAIRHAFVAVARLETSYMSDIASILEGYHHGAEVDMAKVHALLMRGADAIEEVGHVGERAETAAEEKQVEHAG